jgi:1-acyl-sn-glycerol-3-phosphate acyltransferase
MIRSVAYLIAVTVCTIVRGGIVIVAAYLRIKNRPGGVYDQQGRRWAREILWAAGVEVRTRGTEHVPASQPVVYVGNHQSFFDIIALMATVPGTMRFVAKKELAKIPVFGRAIVAAGHIMIDRQNLTRAFDAYEAAAVAVREGMSAVVFAEGTRSRTGELIPFKKGPFVFAIASRVPVVPLYCAGTFTILPKGSMVIRPRAVTLLFGEPIPTEGLDYDDREALLRKSRLAIERLRADARELGDIKPDET